MCNLIWSKDDHSNILISRNMVTMNCENNVQFIPSAMTQNRDTYSLYLVKHYFVEGINQCGLFANIKLINYNKNKSSNKLLYVESTKHSYIKKIGLTRYVLECCSDVKEAKIEIELFKKECEFLKENIEIEYFLADRYENIFTSSNYESKSMKESKSKYSLIFNLSNKSLSIYYDGNLNNCKELVLSEEIQGIGYFFKMRPFQSVNI